jgi:hypothetical protein
MDRASGRKCREAFSFAGSLHFKEKYHGEKAWFQSQGHFDAPQGQRQARP